MLPSLVLPIAVRIIIGKVIALIFYLSLALGWNVLDPAALDAGRWINLLKIRASAGMSGDDSYSSGRYLYQKY